MSFHAEAFLSLAPDKYVLGDFLGKGTYGQVVKGHEALTGRNVAIKQLSNVFTDANYAKHVLREVSILHSLRHENILSLVDLRLSNKDLYVVTDQCDFDLHRIIYDVKNLPGPATSIIREKIHYIYILYQLLEAVKFMHSAGVLHRDIKPANILINSNLTVKLCDFGFALLTDEKCNNLLDIESQPLTEYMVTRWYRAPEVLLSPGRYGKAQDIWSVACSFCELIRKCPLFPGKNTIDQVVVIIQKSGKPTEEDLDFIPFERAKTFTRNISSNGDRLESSLANTKRIHPYLYYLLREMLVFHPNKRITAETAIQNKMFECFRKREGFIQPSKEYMTRCRLETNLINSTMKMIDIQLFMNTKVNNIISDINNNVFNLLSSHKKHYSHNCDQFLGYSPVSIPSNMNAIVHSHHSLASTFTPLHAPTPAEEREESFSTKVDTISPTSLTTPQPMCGYKVHSCSSCIGSSTVKRKSDVLKVAYQPIEICFTKRIKKDNSEVNNSYMTQYDSYQKENEEMKDDNYKIRKPSPIYSKHINLNNPYSKRVLA
mmetsp:Transcript_33880/g.34517  ORF Transcript_33880/g.34517 Transcript_33880/m.34517 type:complete len:545 (+) Transcript_33880:145-1779(+)